MSDVSDHQSNLLGSESLEITSDQEPLHDKRSEVLAVTIEETVIQPDIKRSFGHKAIDFSVNPQPADIPAQLASPEKKKKEDNNQRLLIISKCVALFDNEPLVKKCLDKYRERQVAGEYTGDDTRKRYLSEVGQYRLLNRDEVGRLFSAIDCGVKLVESKGGYSDCNYLAPDIRNNLIELASANKIIFHTNLRFVVHLTPKSSPNGSMELLDLIQEGNLGLQKAISLFNVSRGFMFATYARTWILEATKRQLANQNPLIRVPGNVVAHYNAIRITKNELYQRLQREPTAEEIAKDTGYSVQMVIDFLISGPQQILSLDAPLRSDDGQSGVTLNDSHARDTGSEDQIAINSFERTDIITSLIEICGLSKNEKFVMALRFGLVLPELTGLIINHVELTKFMKYGVVRTYEEIGVILGTTKQNIQQTHARTLVKLQLAAKSEQLQDDD